MTVSTATTRNDATGNGSTSIYNYTFKVFINTELLVTVADTAGAETTLALTTDYTVAGVGDTGGGSITLVDSSQAWLTSGNLTNNYDITIRRNAALTQVTSIRNQTEFFQYIHEDALDLLTMQVQQQQDLLDRCIKTQETEVGTAPLTVLPDLATRKGLLLRFNTSTGNLEAASAASSVIDAAAIHDDVASEISAITAKATPVDADFIIIEDSADSNNKKSVTLSALLSAPVPSPTVPALVTGGRLTLTTAVPITTSDVTGGTIYYTPYLNDEIGISDGTDFALQTFAELSLALTVTSGSNYDVFIYDNAGTLTLELSAAWTNDTTQADALSRLHGVWVKDSAKTRRYIGTIRANASNTVADTTTQRFVWNYYNRVERLLERKETTDSWVYTTNTFRSANNSTANRVEVLSGFAEDSVYVTVCVIVQNTNVGVTMAIGIDKDGTTSTDATLHGYVENPSASVNTPMIAILRDIDVGYHFYQWTERSGAGGTTSWSGDSGDVLAVQSGISGQWRA